MDRLYTCSMCLADLAAVAVSRARGEGLRGHRREMARLTEAERVADVQAGNVPEVREVPGPHTLSWGKLCDVHPAGRFAPQAMRVVEADPVVVAAFRRAARPSFYVRAMRLLGFGRTKMIARGFEGNAFLSNGGRGV